MDLPPSTHCSDASLTNNPEQYPEATRFLKLASVSNIDDPEMPAMTIRMWFIGLFF